MPRKSGSRAGKPKQTDADELWTPPRRSPARPKDELWKPPDTYKPRTKAMRELHDIPDEQAVWRPKKAEFQCGYGCKGFKQHDGRIYHVWDCPYWQREGINETPF